MVTQTGWVVHNALTPLSKSGPFIRITVAMIPKLMALLMLYYFLRRNEVFTCVCLSVCLSVCPLDS